MGKSANNFDEPPPLVLVEGFLSAAGELLWGDFLRYMNDTGSGVRARKRKVIFVSIGPVSSVHDRACELFYALKGGRVDYGATHAKESMHDRFGRSHTKGLYPDWSPSHPLHFLGHSLGGLTIVKLQYLLEIGFFGPEYGPDMILSLNSVQSPFRGTQFMYTCGSRPDALHIVSNLSLGRIIGNTAHLLAYLAPVIPIKALDMHADSRRLAFTQSSFSELLQYWRHSEWARGKDGSTYDSSFEAADERELSGEGALHPRTFYRSWSATNTRRETVGGAKHVPTYDMLLNPPLYVTAKRMGTFDFSTIRPIPSFLRQNSAISEKREKSSEPSFSTDHLGEEYYASDGVVPAFSQWHPYPCSSTRCHHFSGTGIRPDGKPTSTYDNGHAIEPGKWYVHSVDGVSHVELVPFWRGSSHQKTFWREMGEWLRAVDECAIYVRGYEITGPSTEPIDAKRIEIVSGFSEEMEPLVATYV